MDDFLVLCLLSKIHHEFEHLLTVAYLDIKAAFNSVDHLALWKALRSSGAPDVLLHLTVSPGIRQGCILVPDLFCADWILDHTTGKPHLEASEQTFSDLTYANDIAFLFSLDHVYKAFHRQLPVLD